MFRQGYARWQSAIQMLALLASWRCGWTQATAGDTVYRLHGTVENGQTGQPLARALVTSQDRRLATMTNSEGRFDIEVSVPPEQAARMGAQGSFGGLGLMAQRPGFVAQPQPLMLSLDDTTGSTEVVLKLMPAASIAGTISTPTDDAPQGVRVMLFRHAVQDGSPMWMPAGMHSTNSRGEFRFGNLSPGEYTVLATEYRPGGEMLEHSKEITQRYLPVYLGDAASIGSAGKLNLHYGETAQAELHLHLANFYPVKIAVAKVGNAPIFARVLGAGGDTFSGFELGYNARDGFIEGALPDGGYTLLISSFGQPQSFARVPLQVAGAPVRGGPIALAAGGSIEVRVHTELTGQSAAQLPTVHVTLRPETLMDGYVSGGSQPGSETDFTLENAHSGEYFVNADTSQGYVAALTSGQTDLLQHKLSVSASGAAPAIDVFIRDDGATVNGTVKPGDGALPAGSFVFLLPVSGGRMLQTGVGSDGKFTFSDVAPGDYRLLATSSPFVQVPYRDPEAMRAYDGKASTITLAAGQSVSAEAPLIESLEAGTE